MWFRLKTDHETHGDEIHRESWHIKIITKGAPVGVSLKFDDNGRVQPEFIFGCGGLKHLILSMLDLPDVCVKSSIGDVFCATTGEFFHASMDYQIGSLVSRQLIYCPLCGRKLEEEAPYPQGEKSGDYCIRSVNIP